ncbi:hypothetical protein LCGC14_1581860 [marine sediment metagenome]|uniref:Uncharacterized protein n=1 Tax=marine sediment metagenome TaxID=412755 RepID=A0A0F9IGM0_9ZZZZ
MLSKLLTKFFNGFGPIKSDSGIRTTLYPARIISASLSASLEGSCQYAPSASMTMRRVGSKKSTKYFSHIITSLSYTMSKASSIAATLPSNSVTWCGDRARTAGTILACRSSGDSSAHCLFMNTDHFRLRSWFHPDFVLFATALADTLFRFSGDHLAHIRLALSDLALLPPSLSNCSKARCEYSALNSGLLRNRSLWACAIFSLPSGLCFGGRLVLLIASYNSRFSSHNHILTHGQERGK